MDRLVIGIAGASGAVYGIRLLEVLRDEAGVETHLVVSGGAERTIELETDYTLEDVVALADQFHDLGDVAAPFHLAPSQRSGWSSHPVP